MHEVQQLGGGAGHVAVLTGKSAARVLQFGLFPSVLVCLRFTLSAVNPLHRLGGALASPLPPSCIRKLERKGVSGRKYWSEGQGWATCPPDL